MSNVGGSMVMGFFRSQKWKLIQIACFAFGFSAFGNSAYRKWFERGWNFDMATASFQLIVAMLHIADLVRAYQEYKLEIVKEVMES